MARHGRGAVTRQSLTGYPDAAAAGGAAVYNKL